MLTNCDPRLNDYSVGLVIIINNYLDYTIKHLKQSNLVRSRTRLHCGKNAGIQAEGSAYYLHQTPDSDHHC